MSGSRYSELPKEARADITRDFDLNRKGAVAIVHHRLSNRIHSCSQPCILNDCEAGIVCGGMTVSENLVEFFGRDRKTYYLRGLRMRAARIQPAARRSIV